MPRKRTELRPLFRAADAKLARGDSFTGQARRQKFFLHGYCGFGVCPTSPNVTGPSEIRNGSQP